MNALDETVGVVESVGEVSDSDNESVTDELNDEFNTGSDKGSVNDEVICGRVSDHISNFPCCH